MQTLRIAGDETTGRFTPPVVGPFDFARLDRALLDRAAALPGLTATVADVLDELGSPLVVDGARLPPRAAGGAIVGHALTMRYLPERRLPPADGAGPEDSRLSHHVVFDGAHPGDVIVIAVEGGPPTASTFGGMAALGAAESGVGGVVVEGAVRDLDEIREIGLPVWSRTVTPRTGKWRLEAVEINGPVCCGGHQVRAGDLVFADATGVCFVDAEIAATVVGHVTAVAAHEAQLIGRRPAGPATS